MVINALLTNMATFSSLNHHITLCRNYVPLVLQMPDILSNREITKHIVLVMIGLKVVKHHIQFILLKLAN